MRGFLGAVLEIGSVLLYVAVAAVCVFVLVGDLHPRVQYPDEIVWAYRLGSVAMVLFSGFILASVLFVGAAELANVEQRFFPFPLFCGEWRYPIGACIAILWAASFLVGMAGAGVVLGEMKRCQIVFLPGSSLSHWETAGALFATGFVLYMMYCSMRYMFLAPKPCRSAVE